MIKGKLLIATRNRNKLRELKRILIDLPFKIVDLNDLKINHQAAETGNSYLENAKKKAVEYGKITNLLTIADDSGIEAEVLENKLGPLSARYAKGTDRDRCNRLLNEMKNVPTKSRKARYRCVTALYNPETKKTITFEGSCNGFITKAPQGKKGFGYDPIFYHPKLKKTFAQVKMEDKEKYSHRGIAARKLARYLINNLNLVNNSQ